VEGVAREGREIWAKRVARWRESGLTAKEFAAEIGVKPQRLSYGSWQLGAGGDQSERRPAATRQGRAEWVEVVRGAGNHSPGASANHGGAGGSFELILAGGRTLRVPADFDTEALGRLLAVLDAR